MFEPIRKTRVYEEIVIKVIDMIEQGILKSGDQLPSERELSEAFKVSRSSVREALRALDSQGILESRHGNGTYVAPQPIEALIDPLVKIIFTEKDSQMELFEMRRLIEPQLVFLAAQRATPEDINKLEEILEVQKEQVAQGNAGMDFDKSFHEKLVEITRNTILARIMDSVMDCLTQSRDRSLQIDGRPKKSLARHREILDAIISEDCEYAERVMREHLEDIESILFKRN
ncbi:MAG: FadR/GntR family transcriptional regulator [bacterium]